jgi:cytochrome c
MNSWQFNKIAGAVLGTGLLVLGLQNLGGIVFHPTPPSEEKPGFKIEVASTETPAAGGETAAAAVPLAQLLAKADPKKGAEVANACKACHDLAKGGPNKTGPNLWDVAERDMGKHEGFGYSEAMLAMAGQKWTYENLNKFITAPGEFVKGTKMKFGGIKNDEKRANLLAYLQSLSDAPKPFPAQ